MQSPPAGGRLWASVVALSLDQLVAWGVLYYSYAVLAAPIARDLGLPISTLAAAFSGSLLVSSLLARRVGLLLDHRGARTVLLYAAVIAPISFGGIAAVEWELSLLPFFVGLGFAQASSLYEPAFRALVDWFPIARQRSRALLVLTSIAGLASTVFLPLTAALLNGFGWRVAVLVLAGTLFVVTLPIRLLLPRSGRSTPQQVPIRSPVAAVPGSRLLNTGFALQAFAATGATVCLVWQLVERGETLEVAAALAGLAGASQVPGRLLLSPLSNVLSTEVRLPSLLAIQATALLGIATLTGPTLLVALAAFGAAAGVMALERAAMIIDWFGRESFGAASGRLASGSLFARAGAPLTVELLHGSLSYAGVFGVLALCLLVGSAALAMATRDRRRLTA